MSVLADQVTWVVPTAWSVTATLPGTLGGVLSVSFEGNVYVCTSYVRPVEDVGVTVTCWPLMATFTMPNTSALEAGAGAEPQCEALEPIA